MSSEVQAQPVENIEEPVVEERELNFEELLDSYGFDQPQRGEVLKGIVLEVGDDEIIVDIGTKRDAIVPRRDIENLSQEVLDRVIPNEEILVYVLRPSRDGELLVSINKALTIEDWDKAAKLENTDDVIDVTIVGANKGGVLAEFGRIRGFVPNSQLANVPRAASPDKLAKVKQELVGQILKVKIIEVNQRRNRLVMSETAAMQSVREEYIKKLEVGQIIKGQIVGIADYGAFVELGDGVNGLVHISKLDWQHVNHPSEVVSVGEIIEARIDQIDIERERISLNRQAILPDPWDTIARAYNEGDLVTGSVSSVVEYGIFLDLPNGVTGLVHVSEMASYNILDPRKWAQEGAELLVRVISVDAERRRIGLSLDAVEQEELHDWMIEHGDTSALPVTEAMIDTDEEAVEPELEPEADMELETEETADVEPTLEVEAEAEATADVEPTLEVEADAEATADVEPTLEVEAEAELELVGQTVNADLAEAEEELESE